MPDLEDLVRHLPPSPAPSVELRCCCGKADCAWILHNGVALNKLEEEVHTAGRLGQALLVRHEQYMADAEKDRTEMSAKIVSLELDKKELELEHAKSVAENQGLIDQMEVMDGTLCQSEAHIKSLETTLNSTQLELRRLETLATRAYDLEEQLAACEEEQQQLQKTIITTEAEERSAIQRWKKAERRLSELQDQLERIEREAIEERERHVEVLARMKRQRDVEKELDPVVGRLKGAATTAGTTRHGSSVVSHFVKDILQDNANLQTGIVELREMLINSNDEVQTLRDQLMMHQPMVEQVAETLRAELAPKELPPPPAISQELHIHHHYHHQKKEEARRPRKKRSFLSSLYTPSNGNSRAPRGSDGAILAQTSVTIPSPTTPKRWSIQSGQISEFAPSSAPTSPQSMYRNSALFSERGFDLDSSRPTSPGSSVDPLSPQFLPQHHRKRSSQFSYRGFAGMSDFPHNVIHEENDGIDDLTELDGPSVHVTADSSPPSEPSHHVKEWQPALYKTPRVRRSTSHESIISISGLDIHTLKSRPSQLAITEGGAYIRPRSRAASPIPALTVETIASASMITASPTLSRIGYSSSAYLRSTMGHDQALRGSDSTSIDSGSSGDGPPQSGKKFGGWIFGPWGVTPAKSNGNAYSSKSVGSSISSKRVIQRAVSGPISATHHAPVIAVDPLQAFMGAAFAGRRPGINQKGPIPGFKKIIKAPSNVEPENVNTEALREVLAEAEAETETET